MFTWQTKNKVFSVGMMYFLQQLLLFLSITMVPTTKELSCSNWLPPVRIQLCCCVTMETIMMLQSMASLKSGWEAVGNIPPHPIHPSNQQLGGENRTAQ